ncbi:MAG: alpha/beta hydrolase, partial [Erysipelotrichaceae bacterium]|nr:alpha/beta hydrolase [Erysipelotrichaceae bacterium]
KFLFNAIEDEQKNIDKMPKNLPVFFVSGEEDPVGAYGKGVITSYTKFKEAGMTDVNIKLYPGDRHEILNELDRQQVYEDLYTWLENKRTITLGK